MLLTLVSLLLNQLRRILGQHLQIAEIAEELLLLGGLGSCASLTRWTSRASFAGLAFHLRFQRFHFLPCSLRGILLGFGLFNLAYSALDGSIAFAQQIRGLRIGFLQNSTFLGFNTRHLLFVVSNLLLQLFLLLANVLAFVLPIAFIARNVLQMLVVVDMLLAHNIRSTLNNRLGQTNLASYLHRKTTTCLTDR